MNSIQFATLVILLSITVINFARYRDVLYPAVLQSALWFMIVFMFVINQGLFIHLSGLMYLIIVTGVIMFSIGSYFATYDYRFTPRVIEIPPGSMNGAVPRLLFWVSLLGLPLFVLKAYSLGAEGLFESIFINLRIALTDEDSAQRFGILSYLLTISFISVWLQVALYPTSRDRLKLCLSLLTATVYALCTTGRTFFFLLFITVMGILLITRRISPLKGGMFLLSAGLIVFVGIGAFLGKGTGAGLTVAENMMTMLESFRIYLLGALPAFDLTMHSNFVPEYGTNTFRFVFAVLNKVGIHVNVPPLIQDFVNVPELTNVYTVFRPYFLDFGFAGIIAVQLVLGVWHGFIYKRATSGEPFFILVYAVFLYPLIMQFFQDQYTSLLSTWLQYGAVLLLCFCRFEIFKNEKENDVVSRPDYC